MKRIAVVALTLTRALYSACKCEEALMRKAQFFRHVNAKILVVLLVSTASLIVFLPIEVRAQDDVIHSDFEWTYGDRDWTWSLDISRSLYNAYKQVPVSTRTSSGPAGYGFLTTTNDRYVQMIVERLNEAAQTDGLDALETVSFALAFVQSLTYTSDLATTGYVEYPRFPIETLADGGGDCEDTAILFATITLILNYDTVYINPPEHLAVGILGEDLSGSYYTYKNENYYYCETTGEGFEIGQIPSEYKNAEAHIYEIHEYQQYTAPDITTSPPSSIVDNVLPIANAGPDQAANEDTIVKFDGSGSSDNVGIESYTWVFDDGATQTLTGMTPSYTFSTPGVYTITLTVEDAAGNKATDSVYVTVLDVTNPVANAGPDREINEDTPIVFDGSASSDNLGVASYIWSFTAGTTQPFTGMSPSYTFNTPGVYTITLTVRDAAGNAATDTVIVTVLDVTPPAANGGPDLEVNEDTAVVFDGSASSDNVGIESHTWILNDGTTSPMLGARVSYVFDTPGVYSVTLSVEDEAGNNDDDVVTITVVDATDPVAKGGLDKESLTGETISFDGGGSSDNTGVISYDWNFGDGTTGTEKTVTHAYASAGSYTVTLTVRDQAGNSATDTITVAVSSVLDLPLLISAVSVFPSVGAAIFLIQRKHKNNQKKKTT